MKRITPTPLKKHNTIAIAVASTLLLSQALAFIPAAKAAAHESNDSVVQYIAQANGLSPEQDSLLPPDVIPINAGAASAPQSASVESAPRQIMSNGNNSTATATNSNGFLAPGSASAAELQSAQQWQKAAESLAPNSAGASMPFPQSGANQQMTAPGMAPNMVPGMMQPQAANVNQSPWMNSNGQPMQPSQAMPQQQAAQSQTLSGTVRVQNPASPARNGGSTLAAISRVVSSTGMMATGVLLGSLLTRKTSPYALYTPTMFGANLLNPLYPRILGF